MKSQEMMTIMDAEEWKELMTLKDAITYYPASVHPDKQERFTELLVKSLSGKGDYETFEEPTNY